MAKNRDLSMAWPVSMRLNLVREVNVDQYEIFGIIPEVPNCLIITSNGTYELSGTDLKQIDKVDMRNIKTNICIVKDGIIYGTGQGFLFFMSNMYDSRRRFYEQQVISKIFSKIIQVIRLTDSSIVVLGTDTKERSKTLLIKVSPEKLSVEKECTYRHFNILGIIPFSKRTFYAIVNEESQTSKLIHIKATTFKEINSISLDEEILDTSVKMFKAFNDNIIIGYGNKIILCNQTGIAHQAVLSDEQETSTISAMFEMKHLLVVFYETGIIYIMNSELEILSKIDELLQVKKKIVRCELFSDFSIAVIFDGWLLKVYKYDIYRNIAKEVTQNIKKENVEVVIVNEAAKSIASVFNKIENCKPATAAEKAFSEKKFKEISSKRDQTKGEKALLGLRQYAEYFGTDLILCDNKDPNDSTNQLHASLLLNGFLDTNPYYHCMEFGIDDTHFLDIQQSDDLNSIFCQRFRKYLSSFCDIPPDDIVLIKLHNKNISVDFTFTNNLAHEKYSANEDKLKKLIGTYLNEPFKPKTTKLLNIGIHSTLKECKLDLSMFNPRYDNEFTFTFDDDRGGLPYHRPVGWTRLGINIEYFGFKNSDQWIKMDKKAGEWAIAYHGLRTDPLVALGKIMKDDTGKPRLISGKNQVYSSDVNINKLDKAGYGKTCGDGIYCAPKIETSEGYTKPVKTETKQSAILALMCRVNPQNLKIPKDCPEYYIVNNSEDIRPYGILIKLQ